MEAHKVRALSQKAERERPAHDASGVLVHAQSHMAAHRVSIHHATRQNGRLSPGSFGCVLYCAAALPTMRYWASRT